MKFSLLSRACSQAAWGIAALIILPIVVSCTSQPTAQTADNDTPSSEAILGQEDASELSTSSLEPTQSESNSVNSEKTESLATEIGQIEVERVLQFLRYQEYAPPLAELDERQSELMVELKQVAPGTYRADVLSATRAELQAKIGEFQMKLASQKDTLSASEQEVLQAQLSVLKQRVNELP